MGRKFPTFQPSHCYPLLENGIDCLRINERSCQHYLSGSILRHTSGYREPGLKSFEGAADHIHDLIRVGDTGICWSQEDDQEGQESGVTDGDGLFLLSLLDAPADNLAISCPSVTDETKPMCFVQQVANRGRLPFPPTACRPLTHLIKLGGDISQ